MVQGPSNSIPNTSSSLASSGTAAAPAAAADSAEGTFSISSTGQPNCNIPDAIPATKVDTWASKFELLKTYVNSSSGMVNIIHGYEHIDPQV